MPAARKRPITPDKVQRIIEAAEAAGKTVTKITVEGVVLEIPNGSFGINALHLKHCRDMS